MHLEGAQYTFCSNNYQTECYFKKIHIDFIYILNSLLDMNTSSMFLSPCRLVCPFLNLVFWGFFGWFFFGGGDGGLRGDSALREVEPCFFYPDFYSNSIILENRFKFVLVCMKICMRVCFYSNLSIFNVIFGIDQYNSNLFLIITPHI